MSELIRSARLFPPEIDREQRPYAYNVVYTITQSLALFLLLFSGAKQMCKFLPCYLVFFLPVFLAFTLH